MGTYTIVIEGHGLNHNGGYPNDADEMARRFVQMLREAGQGDVRGVFVYGTTLISDGTVDTACFAKERASQERMYWDFTYQQARRQWEAGPQTETFIPPPKPTIRLDPDPCSDEACRFASREPHKHFGAHQPEPL